MEYKQKRLLWYAALTSLLLFYVLVLPRTGLKWFGKSLSTADGISLMGLTVLVISIILATKQLHGKGNLKKYNMKEFELVWKDNWYKSAKNKVLPIICGSYLLASPFLYFVLKDIQYSKIMAFIYAAYFLLIGFSILIVIFTLLSFGANDPQLKIFKEGLLYTRTFIPWEDIKKMNYPKSFEFADRFRYISGFFIPRFLRFYTLRVESKKGDVHIVHVRNKDKFASVLKKLNKKTLLD